MFVWKSPTGNCHFCNSTYEYSFSNFSIVWVIINHSYDKIKFSNMITYSIKESYVYLTFIVWYSFSCLCLIIIFMVARYWILDHQVRKKLYCFSRKKNYRTSHWMYDSNKIQNSWTEIPGICATFKI